MTTGTHLYEMDRTFFRTEPIPPPGQFVAVRDWLLSLDRKRWPTWRLRLAADLVCEMKPLTREEEELAFRIRAVRPAFRGRALCTEGAGIADLKQSPLSKPFWEVRFTVQRAAAQWQWKAGGTVRGPAAAEERFGEVRARALEAFQRRRFHAMPLELLLQPACLACGKKLTDPVSMSRLIGPECAHTASQAGVILWDLAGVCARQQEKERPCREVSAV